MILIQLIRIQLTDKVLLVQQYLNINILWNWKYKFQYPPYFTSGKGILGKITFFPLLSFIYSS